MEAYKDFVRRNRDFVHSLESLANGITWLLPERFSNSEIGPEAVYALLGVISSVNQHIIDTTPSRFAPQGPANATVPWPLCVSALKDLESVVEVAAQHFYGEDGKWSFIVLTEAAKALARLASLRDSGYKMLLQGGEVVNEDRSQNSHGHQSEVGISGRPGCNFGPGSYQGYRIYDPRGLEGRALSALNKFGENARMGSNQIQMNGMKHFLQPPAAPVRKPDISSILSEKGLFGGLFVAGEVLSILRPLVYVLFIRKFGLRSWKPWFLSLLMDITGMGILTHVTQPRVINERKFISLSPAEEDEMKRRKLLWALYIVRDPFFSQYTRRHLEKTDKRLSQVPLVGFITGKVVELLCGAQTRYTYTSGS